MNFTICLIAKNEEKTLPRLIDSLKEYQSKGGEILLLDTGSTDNTIKIAKELGCEVFEKSFTRTIENAVSINKKFVVDDEKQIVKNGDSLFDYSGARNYIASKAKTDMIAMPDCDEVYTRFDLERICQIIDSGAEQLEYNFVFSHDQYGNEAIKFRHCKFYNKKKLEWTGIVHEVLKGEARRVFLDENIIKLEHWQNHDTNRGGYLKGLAVDCFENPDNDRNSHYFGRELLWTGRPKSAVKELKRHIAMDKWPAERAQSMIYIGDATNDLEWYHLSFLVESGRREPLMRLADHFYRLGDRQRTACYAMAALQIPQGDFYANDSSLYKEIPHEMLYWALNSAEHLDKCLEYQPLKQKYIDDFKVGHRLPLVSIVIPSLGRPEKLQRLLDSIKKNANYPNYEVIVELDSFENRQGAPKTLKKGVERSNGEMIMFLGNDCICKPNFLIQAIIKSYQAFGDEHDGLVGLNDCYWHGELATHWLASKKLLPYLGGEFFHTGYGHTGCDNELTSMCKKIGKYIWAEHSIVYHDHPVQTGFKNEDEGYKIAYDLKRMEKDEKLLHKRSKELGFDIIQNMVTTEYYPQVHDSFNLKHRVGNGRGLKALNVGVGDCKSGIMIQMPYLKFEQLDHIDICQEYLDHARTIKWQSKETNFYLKDIREVDNWNDYDLVMIFDVLEHLEKREALEILNKIKTKLIIFIPLEKEFRKNTFDVESQEHLSLWTQEDFKGFKTELLTNFHRDNERQWDALWAIRE